jgi:hypothetical protein
MNQRLAKRWISRLARKMVREMDQTQAIGDESNACQEMDQLASYETDQEACQGIGSDTGYRM